MAMNAAAERARARKRTGDAFPEQTEWLRNGTGNLHDQEWARENMAEFSREQATLERVQCSKCGSLFLKKDNRTTKCSTCRSHSRNVDLSAENDMDPGPVPAEIRECIEQATQVYTQIAMHSRK